MYLPLAEDAEPPEFKACARHPPANGNGFVIYYTDQCPYTHYWVPRVEQAAKEPVSYTHLHLGKDLSEILEIDIKQFCCNAEKQSGQKHGQRI